ncbi:MAG: sigma-70 family RNA polymerase sigma factor [Deltaproteobacteria bacterium]|nr:sigma-70 family RNA polymerase sigma factor [Deltaproteobacteria bacterium]
MGQPQVDELFRRYYPVIRQKCARMLSDPAEAEDVAQETFIRLWRELAEDGAIATQVGWIYSISTRLAIDRLRQRKRRPRAELDETTRSKDDVEGGAAGREWLERIAQVLSAEELEVLMLHRIDRMNQEEIGIVLGCSDRQVRRVLTRCDERLQRLKERLEP